MYLSGRFFDSSTLPSVDSLKHVHATQADLNQKSDGSQIALETALEIQPKPLANHEKNVKSQGAAYSRTNEPSSWAKEESTDAAPSPRSPRGSAGQDNSIKSNGDGDAMDGYKIRPSEASPFSSDDAGSLASSTVRNIVAEQRARNPATVHLPSRDAQEEHLRRYDQERVHDDEPEGGYPDQFGQNVNGLTPPTSGEDVEPSSRIDGWKTKDNDSQHNIILKSQINMARTEAFGGTPATPDEQPRLEEAQSMQASKAPASVQEEQADGQQASQSTPATSNLSSQFLNDNMSEDDAMPDISDLTKHIVSKQDGVTRGGISEQDVILPKPLSGLRDHLFTGMSGESSRDLTLSRRPPMRIDTSVPSISETSGPTTGARPATTSTINSHFQSESSTPNKAAAAAVQSPPERMTTRVSSGALRHKSVSEILGETPKATPIQADRGAFDRGLGESNKADYASLQTPKSASSLTSPDPAIFKQRLNELRDKERSKLSTVVFASSRNSDSAQAQHPDENETPIKDRDYLLTLFAAQATNPLGNLLKTAHKTLNTSDHYTDFHERQACRVLSKIYELQASNRWSLRQIERSIEPKRPVTHWDVLLGQMKWMRTDFREERKWKHAAAKYIADACAEWVASSAEARKVLQVNVRSLPVRSDSMSLSAQTPDLVHSAEDGATEATDDDTPMDSVLENAPAAIFSLPPEMFIFGLNKSPVTEKLLSELPLYQPNTAVQDAALHSTEIEPDAAWKTPIVPVSKYVQGKIVAREGPPRKRRRLDYEDSAGSRFHSRRDTDVRSERLQNPVGPEQYDVALFDPENKHIRDRIHAAHTFRPPSEYSMPQQHFFECRQSSQWTQAEDDELRKDVRDYTYNWALIEDCLTSPSLFSSGAERRTQWECFERWISLEGLPVEMAKTQYFRAYHSRLQAAQNTVQAQQQALQQQHGNNGAQLPPRRRTTQPYTVERRKNARHLHLIDAMRKLAKKRETTLNKQQHGTLVIELQSLKVRIKC